MTQQTQARQHWTYYDTFDWRLYQQNLVLKVQRKGRRVRLRLHDLQGRLLHRLLLDRVPKFSRDLPPGVFRDNLQRLLEMRALLAKVNLSIDSENFRILDRRRKTICRLQWSRTKVKSPERPRKQTLLPRLEVEEVRGYRKACQRAVDFIENGLQLQRDSRPFLEEALAAAGVELAAYSSKVEVELDPALRADSATKLILRQLLGTMQVNQPGMVEDLDSEFLHDFRVAVRRTRSALAQIKGVFPSRPLQRFRREFSWLGKATGTVRDLDVYLLKIPGYQASLPAAVRKDLIPLRKYLRGRKRSEHRKLVRVLKSKRYRRLMAGWRHFLDKPVPKKSRLPRAQLPILEVASDRIWRAYARVIRKGGKIDPNTHPEKLHILRIDCKKLRYLLEFFRNLYPAEDMDKLIKALKRLQDNLGDFNDYVVQQATLKRIATQPDAAEQLPVETLMCIGRLLERLEIGQRTEQTMFLRRFRAFSSPANSKVFARLFQTDRGEATES